jgi:hypothetical protein
LDLAVGFRASSYGLAQSDDSLSFEDYKYLSDVGTQFAGNFKDATPTSLWIVGEIAKGGGASEKGKCKLNFPAPEYGTYAYTEFSECDLNEAALDYFDEKGYKLWLQVEPGLADVEELIDIVLSRYSHHPCVIGFAVDAEWYNTVGDDEGDQVTDSDAKAWLKKIKEYNDNYTLLLKHWQTWAMPDSVRKDIVFLSDSQGADSSDDLLDKFKEWAETYSEDGGMIGFQYGYPVDKEWWESAWGDATDAPDGFGKDIVERYGDMELKVLLWVDFSIVDSFPL